MTKFEFIDLWSRLDNFVSRKFDGDLAWSCNCEFIDHSGGYALELYPNVIVYPEEIQGLIGLAAMLGHRFYIVLKHGYMYIY